MVEFISYDGAYPNLCSGTLVLKVNGEKRELSNCLISGGSVSFDDDWNECVTDGAWDICDLPKDLKPYKNEIVECINENIPWGCCGGCV